MMEPIVSHACAGGEHFGFFFIIDRNPVGEERGRAMLESAFSGSVFIAVSVLMGTAAYLLIRMILAELLPQIWAQQVESRDDQEP